MAVRTSQACSPLNQRAMSRDRRVGVAGVGGEVLGAEGEAARRAAQVVKADRRMEVSFGFRLREEIRGEMVVVPSCGPAGFFRGVCARREFVGMGRVGRGARLFGAVKWVGAVC